MTVYVDTFGGVTLPPSEYGYQALSISTNTTLVWPYNSNGGTVLSKIIDLTATVSSLTLTLPNATEVSTGEDFLIRNVGGFDVSVVDAASGAVATVVAGAARYFYLTGNSTAAGTWGTIAYGIGTSLVDAASLVGYGIMAAGSTLNQSHPVVSTSSGVAIDDTYRAKVLNYTGGVGAHTLTSSVTLGDNFFTMLRNSGTGTLTVDPYGSELIDGMNYIEIQPGESCILVCSGATWYTVGLGRSVVYNFTQLVLDVSGGGTFTLTSAQASNKLLTFIGSPAAGVTVEVPSVVAVYYILSSLSTAQSVTVKTAAGTGVAVTQGARIIAICDSTNVYSAQSVAASSSVSLIDGSVSIPALSFASKTNTGLYKYGASGYGFAVNGVARYTDDGTTVTIGVLTGLVKRTAGVESAATAGTDYTTPTNVQEQTATAYNTGGTATAFTLTPTPALASNVAGARFCVGFHAAAGTTPTLAVSGLTAKALKYRDSAGAKQAVTSTQIPSGWVSDVIYDGTDWMVINTPPVSATSTSVPMVQNYQQFGAM